MRSIGIQIVICFTGLCLGGVDIIVILLTDQITEWGSTESSLALQYSMRSLKCNLLYTILAC